MGIIKFNGITSRDLGVEVETFPDYVAPEKEYQVTHVPGRNGDLVVDTKTFQNVPRSYEVSVATNGVPIEVVNAAVARFKSSSRIPIKSLSSEIKAVQDLHGYDHPWVGGAGKNKFNISSITKGQHINPNNGVIYANPSWNVSDFIQMEKGKVTFSWNSTDDFYQAMIAAYDSTKAFISGSAVYYSASNTYSHTFDVPSNANYIRVAYSVMINGATVERNNIRLSIGELDLGYEPYSNICSISGFDSGVVTRCGKNLLNPTLASGTNAGLTAVRQSDKSYSLTGTATSINCNLWIAGHYITNPSTQLDNSKLYYIAAGTTITYKDCKLFFYDVETGLLNTNFDQSHVQIGSDAKTFTVPHNAWLTGVRMPDCVKGTAYNTTLYPQIELGTMATAYEQYNGNTYTFAFGQTVYGGHFDNKGNLEVNKIKIHIDSSYTFKIGSGGVYIDCNNLIKALNYTNKIICDKLITRPYHYGMPIGSISGYCDTNNSYPNQNWLYFKVAETTTPQIMKDWLDNVGGIDVVYELATPTSLTLSGVTPKTLSGINNIYSNCGDVSVKVEPSFSTIINQVVEWLHSASGYARLEDTYEPDYYRMAYYSESLSVENLFNEAGKATLNFICKPQRYLKSGETSVSFTEEGTIQNGTGFLSSPILKVITDNTQGSVSIGNHTITIKAGAGTDPITIDCELQDAWSGTTNKNPFIILTDGEFPVIDPGMQTITFDGGVQSVEVTPRWWTV